jgi:hypothetical protein
MSEGASDNLMDYNDNGTRLHKYQWDFIHDPEGGLYVFQDEEEGAALDWFAGVLVYSQLVGRLLQGFEDVHLCFCWVKRQCLTMELLLHEYFLTERQSFNEEIEGNYLFHKKRLIRGMSRIKAMNNRSRLKCGTSYEPRLKSMAQIRALVITNWPQQHNLREVQYMVGHKYVSSTQRYRTDNLEDLQKELEKYHPLK